MDFGSFGSGGVGGWSGVSRGGWDVNKKEIKGVFSVMERDTGSLRFAMGKQLNELGFKKLAGN